MSTSAAPPAGHDASTPSGAEAPHRRRILGSYRLPDPWDRIPDDLLEQALAEIEADWERR